MNMGEKYMKNSFILFTEYSEYIEDLSAEQCGYLLKAIFEYEINGEIKTELDISTNIVFKIIKNNLNRANEKYNKSVENGKKGAIYGIKGGRPKPPANPHETPSEPPNNNANININNNVNNNKNKFIPPTIEEVNEFCLERNNAINPETFVSFYGSKGWKIGKEPMRDWKKAIISWELRGKEKEKEIIKEKSDYIRAGPAGTNNIFLKMLEEEKE